jgi:hypothetical protein
MRRWASLTRLRQPQEVVEPKPGPPRECPDVKAFRSLNPVIHLTAHRSNSVLRKFNLSRERYAEMLVEQDGRCAICGGKQKRDLAIDHCHRTGMVRGLLCGKCNTAIGSLNDNPELMRKAAAYVEAHKK